MRLARLLLGQLFLLLQRNPALLATWAAVLFAGSLLQALATRPWLEAAVTGVSPGRGATLSLMFGWLVGGAMVLVLANAVFRAVLLPERHRHAYVRLGRDEARLLGLLLLLAILLYALSLVVGFVLGLAGALVVLVVGADVSSAMLVAALLMVVLGLIAAWAAVRISLAAPMTLLRQRITLRPAWRATKGHAGGLVLAYLAVTLVALLPMLPLLMATWGGPLPPTDADGQHRMFEAALATMNDVSPGALLLRLAGVVIGAAGLVLQLGVAAIALRELAPAHASAG